MDLICSLKAEMWVQTLSFLDTPPPAEGANIDMVNLTPGQLSSRSRRRPICEQTSDPSARSPG